MSVDNKALVSSWESQVSKSPEVSDVMKSIFQFSLSRNLSISLRYVPFRSNPADSPSRRLSDLDTSLDIRPWNLVDSASGPHTIDLLALPSNVKLDRSGHPLRFFSPFPCIRAQGTNVFSQVLSSSESAFVFPPFTPNDWPAFEVPGVATMSFYNYCLRCLALGNTAGPSSSVRLPLHLHWVKRGIIQFFYSPLKQAFLLGNSDHFNGIFGYFALLLLIT